MSEENIVITMSEESPIPVEMRSERLPLDMEVNNGVPVDVVRQIFQITMQERGLSGVGIASITKTSTTGLVDTYTILYTDGTSTTFDVTNGANGEKGDKGDKGDPGTTSWNGIADKPATFPPSSHNHNDLYYGKSEVYTKTETDTAIATAIVGAIEGAY